MASSSSSLSKLSERWADIALEEEDDGGLIIEESEPTAVEGEEDHRWCLAGRLMTDRPIDGETFKHRMAFLWRPGKGMYVKELNTNMFLFQFFHEVDVKRVLEGSPWTFNNVPLILDCVNKGDNPRDMPLHHLSLWVQIYDLRPGFKSEKVIVDIGNYLGSFVASCPKNFMGLWRDYLRVRVAIDVRKPLKRRMKIKKGSEEFWATFKYERLPQLCFICGKLGHSDRFCERLFDTPAENITKPYGVWMRAPERKQSKQIGAKWLRDGTLDEKPSEEEGGEKKGGQLGCVGSWNEKCMRGDGNHENTTHERLFRSRQEHREGMEVDINANTSIGQTDSATTGLLSIMGEGPTDEGIHVGEQKRRRFNEESDMGRDGPADETKEISGVGCEGEFQKNLLGAGSVDQARLEL